MISKKMENLGKNRSVIREIFEYGNKRRAEIGAENVLDFSLGNPSIPAPEKVREIMARLVTETDPVKLHGYTSAQGDATVRKAISDSITDRFGVKASPDLIYMTCGAAASLTISLTALVNDGDEVIALAPFFPEYRVFAEKAGANFRVVKCSDGDFQIDFAALEKAINKNTKAIIVNSPNNPTGVVLSEETIVKLSDLLKKKQAEFGTSIYIICDEPYRELVYGMEVPYIPAFYDNTIVCYSFSKSLSLPGERIGYVAVNPKCPDATLLVNMCGQISRGIGHNCPSSIIQLAVAEVLDKTSDLSVYEKNMNLLYDELTALGFTCVRPGGTFYIFPKALEDDAVAFCNKALKYDLVLVPSDSFGVPGYFRMAYCIDTEKVERSLAALRKFVENEYR